MPPIKSCSLLLTIVLYAISALVFPLNGEPYNGYTLFNPMNSRTTYLLDMDNNRVHTWNNNRNGNYSVYLLENGNLLRSAAIQNAQLRGAAYSGLIQEIDWDGRVVWEFEYSGATYIAHHDIEPMPNGNVLLIAWEVKTAAEALQAGRSRNAAIWPDHIVEVEPAGDEGGEIVWEWHAWDHLIQDYSQQRDNYGAVEDHPELIDINLGDVGGPGGGDWLHINGISYNPDRDEITISSHYLDEIFVIDHSTTTEEAAGHEGGNRGMGGDILYRWGDPGNYRAPGQQYFDVVHCSWWVPSGLPGEGHILAFNNGEHARESQVVEIVPPYDEEGNYVIQAGQAFGPANPIWTYSDGRTFFSNHLGGCQRLPNGNTLITESTEGHILEVNEDGEILWEYDDRSQIARSLRYGVDYPGLYPLNALDEGDVVINEFLVINDTTQADQDGEFDSWIELFNTTDEDVSLERYYLSDDPDDPDKWGFPDTSIAAGSYLIVWLDNDAEQAGLHSNFEPAADGSYLLFTAPNLDIMDEAEYELQSPDRSIGRFPNGTGGFYGMSPSFEAENIFDRGHVVINEFLAFNDTTQADQNGEFDGWIELYNGGDFDFNLYGFFLSDNPNDPDKYMFPDTSIAAGGYLIVWLDGDLRQAGLHATFELYVSGGEILFLTPDLTLIDSVEYDRQTRDRSMGRFPNGTGEFIVMRPTFGAENIYDGPDGVESESTIPIGFSMPDCYPNPFNSSTTFSFQLHSSSNVILTIYGVNGEKLRTLKLYAQLPGQYQICWNGADELGVDVGSGVYLYTLRVGKETVTGKSVLVR